MFSLLFIRSTLVAVKVVNIVRYMPVADATVGCMSYWIITELKIRPGPTPAAAAKKAPKKATVTSPIAFLTVNR